MYAVVRIKKRVVTAMNAPTPDTTYVVFVSIRVFGSAILAVDDSDKFLRWRIALSESFYRKLANLFEDISIN